MPKKRNNAWSRQKKEKQTITARLIEICLKIDEYVYNHKPISNTEAEQFIKEVESYKTTCIRDERSLQVIEKVTRCMKAIILEYQQAGNDYMDDGDICHLGDNRQASVSPVYSTCDEDRTQFSQAIDIAGNSTDANKDNEIIDLCIDYDKHDNCNSNDTASENFIRPFPVNVEIDIHRAVSNLSLQEVPILEEETCSQSILNNFETNDQMPQIPIPNIPNKIIKVPALIIKPSEMFKPVSTVLKNSLEDTIAKLQGDSRVLKTANNNAFNENNAKQANMFHPTSIKIMEHQEKTAQDKTANRRFAVDKSQENYSQPTYCDITHTIYSTAVEVTNSTNTNVCGLTNTKPTNETNQILDKDKQNKNTSSILENTKETKKKRAPRKKKNVEIKDNKTKNPTVKKISNKKTKLPTSDPPTISLDYLATTNPKVPIYNDQVINDLSWMENIRFVREIRENENDQTLKLEESFWDNYHLPASWNDNEFL